MTDDNPYKGTPYSDNYKARYSDFMQKKHNERQEKLPTSKPAPAETPIQKIEQTIKKEEQKIVEEVKEEMGEGWKYFTEPKHVRILKIIAILVPIILILYLLSLNFLISRDFNYFYDIGGKQDAKTPYLSPLVRVSEIINETPNYRNMISGLVYFNAPIPRGSETLQIETRFKDNFPENSKISLGAKDQEVWHYFYNPLYNSGLDLFDLYRQGNVYLLNENLDLPTQPELADMENIVIATDQPFIPVANKISNYTGETTISTSLRGGHTFYLYTLGNLVIDVKKQDINWYNGTDELDIELYDSEENLITNTTIPDDGIDTNKHGNTIIQQGKLLAENLPEGVYKLVFSDFDGLIREIKVNTGKIVAANKVFLADSDAYFSGIQKSSQIYTEAIRPSQLSFRTYHNAGLQTIRINSDNLEINNLNQTTFKISAGDYTIKSDKNDIIVSYPGYFAFSKENYFEPFKQRIIPIQNNLQWLQDNADYLITNYEVPVEDSGWLISNSEFNIKQDNLVVINNQLSMVYSIPHLGNENTMNYTIPIDWINITVHKPGLLEKWRRK